MLHRLLVIVFGLAGAPSLCATTLEQASRQHVGGVDNSARLFGAARPQHLVPNPTIAPVEAVAPAGPSPVRDKIASSITGATFEYDAVGNRTRMVLSNGVITDYAYDVRNRLRELHTHSGGVTIQRHLYTIDASGLRTAVESTDADGAFRTLTYEYDRLKRLAGELHVENGVEVLRATYGYDKVGNRTRAVLNGVTTTYAYSHNDWLLSETTVGGSYSGSTTYTYDDNGNRLSKTGPLGRVDYVYNDANRMTELRDGTNLITYDYDSDGLLASKTFHKPGVPPLTQRFVWDSNREIAQVFEEWVSPAGGAPYVSATYLFADDLIAQTRNGTTSLVIADGMGNTRALADTGGAVTDTFRYDAFGNVIGRSGSTPADHLYRGEQLDPNAGFYYLRARYYDPAIGSFVTMDPFNGFPADPTSAHDYAYVSDNPVNRSDPSGLCDCNTQSVAAAQSAGSTMMSSAMPNLGRFVATANATQVAIGSAPILAVFGGRIQPYLNGAGTWGLRALQASVHAVARGGSVTNQMLQNAWTVGSRYTSTLNNLLNVNARAMGMQYHKLLEASYRLGDKITYSLTNIVPTPNQVHSAISAVHSTNTPFGMTLRQYVTQQIASGRLSVDSAYRFEAQLWQLAMQRNGAAIGVEEALTLLSQGHP